TSPQARKLMQQYGLVYLGKQRGRWKSTMRYHNQLMNVNVGSTLPNGFKVTSIAPTHLVLKFHSKLFA
ncbi:unnamed protein product, partial [marine sediment metagenome]